MQQRIRGEKLFKTKGDKETLGENPFFRGERGLPSLHTRRSGVCQGLFRKRKGGENFYLSGRDNNKFGVTRVGGRPGSVRDCFPSERLGVRRVLRYVRREGVNRGKGPRVCGRDFAQ